MWRLPRFIGVFALIVFAIVAASTNAIAAPAHGLVVDPAGDTPYSFSEKADLVGVEVTWSDQLMIRATYAAPPPTPDLHLLVSSAARDELRPDVEECDPNMAEMFTVDADADGASFRDPYIEGELRASPSWDGTTVTYVFSSPTLVRKFNDNDNDPFACLDGVAQEDAFYGPFDGKLLKLTAATAEEGARRELDARFHVGRGPGTRVRCLSRGRREETEPDEYGRGEAAKRWCAYRARLTRSTVGYGEVSIFLAEGEPQAADFYIRRFPTGTQECGTTDFSGRWLLPPFPERFGGAAMTVWAKRTSCRTARRVARGRPRTGFRCRTTKSGWEFVAKRCTRAGGRIVWFEAGS